MSSFKYIAVDLGAESGRVMMGAFDGGKFSLEEIHRFPNTPIKNGKSLYWNMEQLWRDIRDGLKKVAALGVVVSSISVDTWGVDYVLVDEEGNLMEPAFHYRDPRTARGVEQVFSKTTREEVFSETGVQFMPINTLYQLASESPFRLLAAKTILGVGDWLHSVMTGSARMEISMASTYQLYNPAKKAWSQRLIDTVGFPPSLFPKIVSSGTRIGELTSGLASELGLEELPVIATCSHDTAAAVAAVPAEEETNWGYLSSGTWSLMGVELEAPILTGECRELNFTNEIGYGDSIRFLKNLSGLWLIQECRREWESEGRAFDYAELTKLAEEAEPFRSMVNPMDPRFVAPDGMPGRIAAACRETGQPAPETPGQFIRCALESLALIYRHTAGQIEKLTGRPIEKLHIVGGGSRNNLLNQFVADSLDIPVVAGPVEATALGNVAVQAITLGHIGSLGEARKSIRSSFDLESFQPVRTPDWNEAFNRFVDRFGL